jgi:glycosyltransferase involved in cell wall biosynthesis
VLEKIIDELKLKDRVTLLGAVSEQVVRDGLEKSHAFALASLNEPLGVVIMEAMAMEVPVVVTGSGGVAELVDDEVDGILVEPRDPSDIALGLERIAGDGVLATRLASAGREKVIRSFQSDRSAQALLRHLM